MDVELKNFIKVWFLAITSLCYCYYIVARIPRGLLRLLSLLPIFYLFIILPFNLSSVHLSGPTILLLVWLANSKLLLFSFDLGPLSPPPRKLLHFISIACLPIGIKQNPPPKPIQEPLDAQKPSSNSESTPNPPTKISTKLFWSMLLVIKALLLAIIIRTYEYRPYLHPYVVLALYCGHAYLALEIALALIAAPARALCGFELEPQFNEPYLSTSLQDFWGRRWNLMVTNILRPTIYDPIRGISTRIIGRRWSSLPAIMASFLVSGLMHEVIFYYLTRVRPTWEVTWFFVLHGMCMIIEVVVKKAVTGRWRLHRAASGPLTVGFVAVTSVWLFFPQILRNGVAEKAIREYSILVDFVMGLLRRPLGSTQFW